jgi:ankyrin repeat protein
MSSNKSQLNHLPKDEIFHAIQSGNLDLLKTHINAENVNIKDRSGYTLLQMATNAEKVEIAKWLVSMGGEINMHCNGNTAVSLALSKGNFELFNYYLKNNGDCKGRNQLNLLHEAANKDRCDIVETLIERGADPNQLNSMHYTPLTIAVMHKNKKICQVLLENGACATIPDKKGNTALHLACSLGDSEIISILLDNTECDLKLKNSNDETALDILWILSIKEAKTTNYDLINRFIQLGAVFSMPWNFTFNCHNHVVFIRCMSILCKYRLKELFLNDKPLLTELIINGYWRNSLIVSIKTAIIDHKAQTAIEQKQLYESIETIIISKELDLTESDLCSTFYMFDEVDDFEVYKMLKKLFTNPFSLKSLARIQIRKELTNINKENVEQFKNLSEDLKNFLLFN